MNTIERYLQAQSRIDTLTRYYSYKSTKCEARPTASLVLSTAWLRKRWTYRWSATIAWPSKRTREKHSLSARSWLRALMAESMIKHEHSIWWDDPIFLGLDVASCTRIIGIGIPMECMHLCIHVCKYTSNMYGWRFHTQLSPHVGYEEQVVDAKCTRLFLKGLAPRLSSIGCKLS